MQNIPWHEHISVDVTDLAPDGTLDTTEALTVGGTTTGLQVTIGRYTDPSNPNAAARDASFVADPLGRVVRFGATSATSVVGTAQIMAPGVSDPIGVPYTTGAMPDQSALAGVANGPFPGL